MLTSPKINDIGNDDTTTSGQGNVVANRDSLAVGGNVGGDVIFVSPVGKSIPNVGGDLRRDYLSYVLQASNKLSLTSIDPKAASNQSVTHLNLNAVYTALMTTTLEAHHQIVTHNNLLSAENQRRVSALEQLNKYKRLVLLGYPGSGKTTFVNFIALCLAGEALLHPTINLNLLTAPLSDDEDQSQNKRQVWKLGPLLPLRVVLRDFSARGLPYVGQKVTANPLWHFIVSELKNAELGDYADILRTTLRKEGGLLLLDGLDEVPESNQRRIQIKEAIEDFADSFPNCRILVTSRVYAYQQQDWRLPAFYETILAPFGPSEIKYFIDRWYAHTAELRTMSRADAQKRGSRLKQAIFSNSRLLALAERPLLLTLMASLHVRGNGSLPEKREELYADAVDLLLDNWESAKIALDDHNRNPVLQPSLTEWLNVDREKIQIELNSLAFDAHAGQSDLSGTADIPEEQLITRLLAITNNPDVKPMRLVEYLSDRAGLLLPRGVKVYTFPHRTFQEYLAARHLTEVNYPYKIAELARKDPNRWREVILLAGAKAARGTRAAIWMLADALCYRSVTEAADSLPDQWGAHLAAQILIETTNLSQIEPQNQKKLTLIKEWLAHLLQTPNFPTLERALIGRTLAKLGDPRPGVGVITLTEESTPQKMSLPDIIWQYIPTGKFVMGSSSDRMGQNYFGSEIPQHQLNLPAYAISRYPVTNAQFNAFVEADGYRQEKYWRASITNKYWSKDGFQGWQDAKPRVRPYDYGEPFTLPNHPVVGVSWYETVAFCNWLEEQFRITDFKFEIWRDEMPEIIRLKSEAIVIRLPTEAEWEKAARGNDARMHPWGNKIDPNKSNYYETGIGVTNAVGCFPEGVSPWGCEEMSDNAWEWCSTAYQENAYPFRVKDEWASDYVKQNFNRVLRGGAFNVNTNFARCTARYWSRPDVGSSFIGFRLALAPLDI